MLSTNPNMVVAGVISVDDEFCPIYVHTGTGDCAYEEPSTTTPILISEVSVDDPLECHDIRRLENNLNQFSANMIGLILKQNGKAVVIIDEDTAAIRDLSNLTECGEIFSIDMTSDYEDDDEE